MTKEEKVSIFRTILIKNLGLLKKMSQGICASEFTIRTISLTGRGNDNIKNNILDYLIQENYIREGEYTITELFNI